jgi:hypothetical protein
MSAGGVATSMPRMLGRRHHHLPHGLVGELEDVVDQLLFRLLEDALGRALTDERADLGFRHERRLRRRGETERAQDGVRGCGQYPHERAGEEGEPEYRPRHAHGQPLRVAERDGLRHQLADDQRRVGDGQHDQGERQRARRLTGAEAGQDGGERLGGGGAADRGGQRADERDPDLDGGQEGVRRLLEPEGGRDARRPRPHRLQAARARGHQGDLRGREEAVQQDAEHDGVGPVVTPGISVA